jgi:hypothetical protein
MHFYLQKQDPSVSLRPLYFQTADAESRHFKYGTNMKLFDQGGIDRTGSRKSA